MPADGPVVSDAELPVLLAANLPPLASYPRGRPRGSARGSSPTTPHGWSPPRRLGAPMTGELLTSSEDPSPRSSPRHTSPHSGSASGVWRLSVGQESADGLQADHRAEGTRWQVYGQNWWAQAVIRASPSRANSIPMVRGARGDDRSSITPAGDHPGPRTCRSGRTIAIRLDVRQRFSHGRVNLSTFEAGADSGVVYGERNLTGRFG